MNYCEHSYTTRNARISTLTFLKTLRPLVDPDLQTLATIYNGTFISQNDFEENLLIYEISFTDKTDQENFSEEANKMINYYTTLPLENSFEEFESNETPSFDVYLKLSNCINDLFTHFTLIAPMINYLTDNGLLLNDYEQIKKNVLLFLTMLENEETIKKLPQEIIDSLESFSDLVCVFEVGKLITTYCNYTFNYDDSTEDTICSKPAIVSCNLGDDSFDSDDDFSNFDDSSFLC